MKIAVNRSKAYGAVILAMGAQLLSVTIVFANDTDDAAQLIRIREQWKEQRSNVQTAVIEYRCVSRPAQPKPNREAVLALIAKADLAGNDAALGDFITALDTTLKGQKELWSNCTFTVDVTGNLRNDSSSGNHSSEVRVGDDTLRKRVVDLQGRNQIDVYGKTSKSHYGMRRLSDFVEIPEPRLFENAVVIHDKQIGPAGRITIERGILECEVDEETGFVYGYRHGKPNDRVCREILQFGPTMYEDGILLPEAAFSANYRFGVLDKFSICIINHAVVNGDIDPSTFAVGADKDDIVVDHRVEPASVVTVQEHVSDILGP